MTAVEDRKITKRCRSCNEEKPLVLFYKNARAGDGYAYYCKKCSSENRKANYHELKTGKKVTSRADRFVAGMIDPSELTQEELSGGFIYQDDGSKYSSQLFDKRTNTKFVTELTKRLNAMIRDKSGRALEVMFEIMDSDLVEPETRLKASQWWIERLIGKTPEKLEMSLENNPHEAIYENLVAGSRSAYRAALGNAIDAEVVEDGLDESENNTSGQDGNSDDENDSIIVEVDGESHKVQQMVEQENTESVVEINPSLGTTSHDVQERDSRDRLFQSDTVETNSVETAADAIVKKQNEAKELKKRVQAAKKRRIVARALGASTTANLPWLIDWRVVDDGLVACLVPPDRCSQDKLAAIAAHDAETNDEVSIAMIRANQLAAQVEKLHKKAAYLRSENVQHQ